jgi:hypothetical protein
VSSLQPLCKDRVENIVSNSSSIVVEACLLRRCLATAVHVLQSGDETTPYSYVELQILIGVITKNTISSRTIPSIPVTVH